MFRTTCTVHVGGKRGAALRGCKCRCASDFQAIEGRVFR